MGLQNPDPRFESGCRLQSNVHFKLIIRNIVCRGGGIGRRKGLKILRLMPVPVRVRPSAPAFASKVFRSFERMAGFGWHGQLLNEFNFIHISLPF